MFFPNLLLDNWFNLDEKNSQYTAYIYLLFSVYLFGETM